MCIFLNVKIGLNTYNRKRTEITVYFYTGNICIDWTNIQSSGMLHYG